jgi:hypothetical protein
MVVVDLRCRWSASEGAHLYEVVGEDAVSGPNPGSFGAIQAAAVPSVPAFETADPAFAAG